MEELSKEEVAVISAAISVYLDLEDLEKVIFPVSKWKIAGRNDGLERGKKVMKARKFRMDNNSKWKVSGRVEFESHFI